MRRLTAGGLLLGLGLGGFVDGIVLHQIHLVGLLLAGWGLFNLVEGLVDHHILGIHHVRDDVAHPLRWDLGFLALGLLLLIAGTALARPMGATSARST